METSVNLQRWSGGIYEDDMNNIYYNYDKLFSYNFLIAFVIGERGCGKSYGSKIAVMKKYLKTGEQFIYLRRYKTELDTALTTFWNDVADDPTLKDHKLAVKKSKTLTELLCDGKVCGYAVPLSTANILKSTPFPKVKTIIFDEFLLDVGGSHRYLRNEMTMFLDVIETVFRLREGQTILLGNCLAPHTSPYFAYWDLELPYGESEFRTFRDGAIVVNYIRNLAYRKAKKESRFGKLIDGTLYGQYAIDNQALRENNNFIEKKPPTSYYECTFVINGYHMGMWNGKNGCLYLSEKHDPNSPRNFVFDYTDHTEGTVFTSVRDNLWMRVCIRAYKIGALMFESQKIKANAVKLLNKCIAA